VREKQLAIDIRRMKSEFVRASKQIAAELGISVKSTSYDLAYEKDSDFAWWASSQEGNSTIPGFTLSLDLDSRWSGKSELKLSVELILDIYYEKHAQPFEIEYTFENAQNYLDIVGWVGWALHSFNLKFHPLNLESRFANSSIRVYGSSKSRLETLAEFYLLMNGLRASQSDVIVLKLRHVDPDDWMRYYSYAVWAEPKYSGIWVFFLNASGLDSGGARRDLAIIEKLIGSLGKKRISVTTHDVSLRILESFLARMCRNINSFDNNFSLQSLQDSELHYVSDVFGLEITESVSKATESFWSRDYARALRDLRAVVQDTLELVAERESIDLSGVANPSVNKIARKLIEEKILDGRLASWFDCFTSFANVASHGNFPSEEDWKNTKIRARALATFVIGRQLLVELKHCLEDGERGK
jgi:hypothetical protein